MERITRVELALTLRESVVLPLDDILEMVDLYGAAP
jgi:hypothetical protein